MHHRAVIAFGSNVGDRVGYIENALRSLREEGITIVKLSRLYETKAMYYEVQDSFLNGAVLVRTSLAPLRLLDVLQKIELEQGRDRKIEKGPRTLDLDIILYEKRHIEYERLKVPHPLMMEREFVLRPLADVSIGNGNLIPPQTLRESGFPENASMDEVLEKVSDPSYPMLPVTYISPNTPLMVSALTGPNPTHVMAILNITPDSFSDGGKLTDGNIHEKAKSYEAAGATIFDVGGQSTRPQASLVTAEEELSRVLPALKALRDSDADGGLNVAVSLDTFYASVARACAPHVDIINDITGGTYGRHPQMFETVAEMQKTIVLMHMRGTPQTMSKREHTDYSELEGVVRGVATELVRRLGEALAVGIPPWRIILDPGVGFAKTLEGNLELLRAGPAGLVAAQPQLAGYPWLVGPSRKGFVGKITGVKEAEDRNWGTAACVSAAVATGADIVRVHDVEDMVKVVKMADAIYRRPAYKDIPLRWINSPDTTVLMLRQPISDRDNPETTNSVTTLKKVELDRTPSAARKLRPKTEGD